MHYTYVCREGMLKMKDVYVNNPALGDPNALEKKIEENALKIDSLQAEMRKFQVIKQIYCLLGLLFSSAL